MVMYHCDGYIEGIGKECGGGEGMVRKRKRRWLCEYGRRNNKYSVVKLYTTSIEG